MTDFGSITSALGGGVIGAIGSAYAAKQNLKAVRETNAANAKLAQEQRDFEYRMVQEQNAYNSMSAQRQRLEEAGYSPYMLTGSNSVMQSSIPQYQRAEMQAPNYDMYAQAAQKLSEIPTNIYNNMLSSANAYSAIQAAEKTGAEKTAVDQENAFRTARILLDLSKAREEAKSARSKSIIDELNSQILGAGKKALMQRESLQNEFIAQQITKSFADEMYARSQVSLNAVHAKFLDSQLRQNLALSAAQTAYYCAQRKLSIAETRQAVANTILSGIHATGARLDNDAKRVANAYVDSINQHNIDYLQSRINAIKQDSDWRDYDELLKGAKSIPIIGIYR